MDSVFDFIHREHNNFLKKKTLDQFDPWLRGCWHSEFDSDAAFAKLKPAILPLDPSRVYPEPLRNPIRHQTPILDEKLEHRSSKGIESIFFFVD